MPRGRTRREAPDPPPKREAAMVTVEEGVRLSASRLWRLQRAFFEAADPRAWARTRVPSYITTNAFIARAMGRVVGAFLDDLADGRLGAFDAERPVHVLELGAGSGKLAHGILRELAARRNSAKFRYVATDLARAPIDALRANPRLAPFVERGLLDFAVYDAEAPGDVRLLESGAVLRAAHPGPLVVIGSYLFDGIPADAYVKRRGELRESLLQLSCPADADPESPATLGRFVTAFRPGALAAAPYEDAHLDTILAALAERVPEGHIVFPHTGLRLVQHLRALSGGQLLLLAADRGHVHEDALAGLDAPKIERHGSFSLDVNFQAFALDAQRSRGVALLPTHHPTHLATTAFLWGAADAERTATRAAYERELGAGGPEDLFTLKLAMEPRAERADAETALAWLRTLAWDPEVFHLLAPALLAAIPEAHPSVRADILDAARRVREAHYPIGEERDVAFALGEVFDALDVLAEAEAAFRDSLASHGAFPDTLHRLAGCALAQDRPAEALARLDEALAMDPKHEDALAMRETVVERLAGRG